MNTTTKRIIKVSLIRLTLLAAGLALVIAPMFIAPIPSDMTTPEMDTLMALLRNAFGVGLIWLAVTPKAKTIFDLLGL